MKTCSKCGGEKPLDAFHRRSAAKDGRHSYCKECACAYSRKWAKDNPERNRENSRRWAGGNREYYRENARAWAAQNPERRAATGRAYYAENREAIIERASAWNSEHPHTFARRRARKANAPFQVIAHPVIREAEGCYWCGSPDVEHLDHVLPLKLGGPHCAENLADTCAACNMSKGSMNPWRWIAELVST